MKTGIKRLLAAIVLLTAMTAASAQDGKITVLNPKGSPPPIPLAPMAPRPASLDGRTVYFVDVKYEGGGSLLRALMGWVSKNAPTANLVFREKAGTFEQEDTKLWAELKDKADAVVLAVGH
jgi:hypothetical protein